MTTIIKVIALTFNFYSGYHSSVMSDNVSMFQYSFNKAMCNVYQDEQSCVGYCYDADYMGHDLSELEQSVCAEWEY